MTVIGQSTHPRLAAGVALAFLMEAAFDLASDFSVRTVLCVVIAQCRLGLEGGGSQRRVWSKFVKLKVMIRAEEFGWSWFGAHMGSADALFVSSVHEWLGMGVW